MGLAGVKPNKVTVGGGDSEDGGSLHNIWVAAAVKVSAEFRGINYSSFGEAPTRAFTHYN